MENYFNSITAQAAAYAPKVVLALITLFIGFWLANKISQLVSAALRSRKVEETVIPFLSSIVSTVLKIMVVISVAGMFGIETTSFVAIVGAAGLAVGLALQGSLGHFASGVLLLIFRPYKVGDLVTIAGFTGDVESIQIFNTVLKTLDNKHIIIPNGLVTSGAITNSSSQGTIRVDMVFAVDGGENIDKVRESVRKVANSCPLILTSPPVDILVTAHDVGIMKFDVRPWCKSSDYWEVYYYMQENVKKQFGEDGIRGPKPAMDLAITNHN